MYFSLEFLSSFPICDAEGLQPHKKALSWISLACSWKKLLLRKQRWLFPKLVVIKGHDGPINAACICA